MAPLESENEVRAIVPDAAFKRGKELIAGNKLHDTNFQGELLERATAICGGSNPGDSYDISVIIDSTGSSKPICVCSCPAGRGKMCKHAVALLLLRTKEFQKDIASHSASEEDGAAYDGENESSMQITWVSNPEKLVPDPNARRALPKWMSEEPVEKKGRGAKSSTKKQKVESEDPDDKPVKKTAARRSLKASAEDGETGRPRRKGAAARSRQSDETEVDVEAVSKTTRKATGRRLHKKASGDDDERSRKDAYTNDSAEQQPSPNPPTPQNRSRIRKQDVVEVPEGSDGGGDVDLTTDDLLSIAQQHLESPGAHTPPQPMDESQPAKKPKLDKSIFSTSSWRDISVPASSDGDVREEQTEEQQPHRQPSNTTSTTFDSADALANDMFGLMFGPSFGKGLAPTTRSETQPEISLPVPAPAYESREAPSPADKVVDEVKRCSTTLQPKPKKKSSLKSQIDMLLS